MKHPNATAALTAGSLTLAGEQLLDQYVTTHLSGFWARAIVVVVPTVVLYIGRNGVKGALRNALAVVKACWSGKAEDTTR